MTVVLDAEIPEMLEVRIALKCHALWTLNLPCDCCGLLDAIERNHKYFNSAARTKIFTLAGRERRQREHHRPPILVEKRRAEEVVALLAEHIRDTQRSIRAEARGR